MIRTNEDQLVEMAIAGTISPPAFRRGPFIPDNDGLSVVLPGMYGYVYNVRVGDPAFGWQGDHVEPGASIDAADAASTTRCTTSSASATGPSSPAARRPAPRAS
jgi:hypothetical protein